MATVDDDACRPHLGGGVKGLLQQLAAGNANAVVEGGNVDDEGRVHHELQPGFLSSLLEGLGTSGKAADRLLPGLRVPQADLGDVGSACCRLCHGVGGVDMTANDPLGHANTVPRGTDRSVTDAVRFSGTPTKVHLKMVTVPRVP